MLSVLVVPEVGLDEFSSSDPEPEVPVEVDTGGITLLVVRPPPWLSPAVVVPADPVFDVVGFRGTGTTGIALDSSTSKLELTAPELMEPVVLGPAALEAEEVASDLVFVVWVVPDSSPSRFIVDPDCWFDVVCAVPDLVV